MKKAILSFVLIVSSLQLLFSQQNTQNTYPQGQQIQQTQPYHPVQPAPANPTKQFPYQFGIRISPNISWMSPSTDAYTSKGTKLGFSFGLAGEYKLSDNYAFSFGVNSVSTGGKMIVTKDVDTLKAKSVTTNYTLRYLEIPFKLKMMTNEINKIQYFFEVGMGTNILFRTKGEETYNGITQSVSINNRITLMKESFLAGIGAQTRISGNTKVFGGLLYNSGFTNIMKGTDTVTIGSNPKTLTPNAVNSYVELNLGILF
ncbi:MAG: porin family protein [Bacteroidota bacterium]